MRDGINIPYDLSMAVASAVVLLLIIVLFMICRRKPAKSQECIQVKLSAQPWLLSDVHAATDGFNPRRIIGKGQLGIVYVAISTNGAAVAVKRINPGLVLSNAGFGFSSIMKWLSLANHKNILPIIGYSEAPGERIILMEFMGMNSLEFYLHQHSSIALDWSARVKIAAGAARGIAYLHQSMNPCIIHGCIKPSNILIDVDFSARVCDYGMSYLALQERRCVVGYVDGEKGVCKENDVYGFGVVLLELLSGRLCEGGLLLDWALPLIRNMDVIKVLDPTLKQDLKLPVDAKPLFRLAKLASACVGNSRKNRPSMIQVAAILTNLEMQL